MYEELVRQLRACIDENIPCEKADCGYKPFENEDCIDNLMRRAADAIEELSMKLHGDEARINLNEVIKVKLTDLGKDIYYHQFDELNRRRGRIVIEPSFPKEDAEGYTKFQLWDFMEIYGEHIGMAHPNVIKPLEIIYELPKEKT